MSQASTEYPIPILFELTVGYLALVSNGYHFNILESLENCSAELEIGLQ